MADAGTLKLEVVAAFKNVVKPGVDQIAPHQCLECDELRCALHPYESVNVPDSVMDKHRGDLPLLSDESKHYYLPAWVLRSIDAPDSYYTDALIFALDSDHCWEPSPDYSKRQWRVLLAYLDHIRVRADAFSRPGVDGAIARTQARLELCAG